MSREGQCNIYTMITEQIIEALQDGTVPWRQTWRGLSGGKPANLKTKKPYRGVNIFLLTHRAMLDGFTSRWWLSFKQASDKGGKVKKGSRSQTVIFWKPMAKTQYNEEREQDEVVIIPLLRYYRVFNLDQIEGIEDPDNDEEQDATELEPIEEAEHIVNCMPNRPKMQLGSDPAYSPRYDTVFIPDMKDFESGAEYYAALFHELTHSTGHTSRLNRGIENNSGFGSDSYSKEELIAEMGAAFLCGETGIEQRTIENHAAYIDGWLKKLREDSKLIVKSAAAAQSAADYILRTDNEEE